jgi:arylsulfatase
MQDAYAGKYDGGYDVLRQRRMATAKSVGVLPAAGNDAGYISEATAWDSLDDEDQALNARVMEIYASMVAHLDAEIGRLLARLEGAGALDNTLILFINDNGAQGGPIFGGPRSYMQGRSFDNRFENLGAGSSWANVGQGWAEAGTAPFRDSKSSPYEGALRVAAFAHWPGVVTGHGLSEQFLSNMDVMPTILELAGLVHPAPVFDGRQVESMRGKSFADVLRGDDSAVHGSDEAIALSGAGRHFMYRGEWKLLKELNSDWELYNLSRDPYERDNLAGERPELLQELLVQFELQADLSNILER